MRSKIDAPSKNDEFRSLLKEKKITKIFFDRGIYKYHGRVKIFAETLRKNGMEF